MDKETASRSQRMRQRVLNSTRPIGSIAEVTVELEGLHLQVEGAQETLAAHRWIHRNATAFPWFFPFDERRDRIQRLEDKRLAGVEDRLRGDVLAVVHRASSILQQLRARAAGVEASVLLCSDLAEALVLQALILTDPKSTPGTSSQLEPPVAFDLVSAALEEVKVPRLDYATDELIERARDVALAAAMIYADIARSKQERAQ